MITIHDMNFNIILANRAATDILALPTLPADIKYLKCVKYNHGTDCPPEMCPSCNCIKTGKSVNFEVYEPHQKMFIEIRAMPRIDLDNNVVGVIHIGRDITERNRLEELII